MKSIRRVRCAAISSTTLAGLLLMVPLSLQADTLAVPLGQQAGQTATPMPQRGLNSAGVRQRYGEPDNRHAAVGNPPISRWDYTDFSVYFEHDKVIHSVRQHRPRSN